MARGASFAVADCVCCAAWRLRLAWSGMRRVLEAPSAERMLAEALEANRQLSELADGLIEDNALLREQVARLAERDAERDAELEKLRADFAVLQQSGGGGKMAGAGPARRRW